MFDYVDLEDSGVLSWNFNAEFQQLVFELEASLWEGHQYYTKPLPEHYTCYKPAKLVFDKVTSIDGLLPMDKAKSTLDPDGTTDYGNIEGFREVENGVYKFGGDVAKDWGEVTVTCENVRLEFNSF